MLQGFRKIQLLCVAPDFAVCCMVNRELVSSITGLMFPSSTLSYVKGNRNARIYFLNMPLVTFFILSATQQYFCFLRFILVK